MVSSVFCQMNLTLVLLVGVIVGALEGGTIFFAPDEPYKWEICLAAALKGSLVGLLTGLSLGAKPPWWEGLGYGLLYGLVLAMVVFLAKGGFRKADDAPYVLPAGAIFGAIIGWLVASIAFFPR